MAEEASNETERQCPYCGYSYEPDSETYSEDSRVEKCEECGKRFFAYDSFAVTHYASPNCEINGEDHEWQRREVRGGRAHLFCPRCKDRKSIPPNAENEPRA